MNVSPTPFRNRPALSIRSAIVSILFVWFLGAAAHAQFTYYLDIPYGTKLPTDPLYDEQTFDILYPSGSSPAFPGSEYQPRPYLIQLHGGNENTPYAGLEKVSPITLEALNRGFIVIIPNYHVINFEISESWVNASKDIARCIQFSRYFAEVLNLDPQKLFLQGHSSGGFQTYYMGLNIDYQNLASRDPIEKLSSRPNYILPWGAPSQFNCLDVNYPGFFPSWASQYFFGVPSFALVPPALLVSSSPKTWLMNPADYGRTYTPPMCLTYNLDLAHPCGTINDTHDGEFGNIMKEAIDRFCEFFPGEAVCGPSILINNNGSDLPGVIVQIVDWMEQMALLP
ncbi:MAG: hypothetical protein ACKVS6_01805 [Planctomycetota bacterium]